MLFRSTSRSSCPTFPALHCLRRPPCSSCPWLLWGIKRSLLSRLRRCRPRPAPGFPGLHVDGHHTGPWPAGRRQVSPAPETWAKSAGPRQCALCQKWTYLRKYVCRVCLNVICRYWYLSSRSLDYSREVFIVATVFFEMVRSKGPGRGFLTIARAILLVVIAIVLLGALGLVICPPLDMCLSPICFFLFQAFSMRVGVQASRTPAYFRRSLKCPPISTL